MLELTNREVGFCVLHDNSYISEVNNVQYVHGIFSLLRVVYMPVIVMGNIRRNG